MTIGMVGLGCIIGGVFFLLLKRYPQAIVMFVLGSIFGLIGILS